MKTYMLLNGLRWSRNSGSILCNTLKKWCFRTAWGIFGGLFQVPCLTIIQKAPIGKKLGSVLAYVNLLTFIFVLIGAGIFSISTSLSKENSYLVFGIIAIICLISIPLYLNQNKKTLPSKAK